MAMTKSPVGQLENAILPKRPAVHSEPVEETEKWLQQVLSDKRPRKPLKPDDIKDDGSETAKAMRRWIEVK